MEEQKTNSKMHKPIALLLTFVMLFSTIQCPAAQVEIKSGTLVNLELINSVDGNYVNAGQLIDFKVLQDVVVEQKTVIPAGSIAKGQVNRVKKSSLLGLPGEMEVIIRSIKAVDGTEVFLTGPGLINEGENRLAISVILTVFCIFGFLIKGGKAEIKGGMQCTAIVAGNTLINVE